MVLFSFILEINSDYESLNDCFSSFSSQSFCDFEIICLNNNLSEDILNLIDSYTGNLNIHLFKNFDNLFSQINGEYVCFINSDFTLTSTKSLEDISINLYDIDRDMFSTNIHFLNQTINSDNVFYNLTHTDFQFLSEYTLKDYFSTLYLTSSFFKKDFLLKKKINYNNNHIVLFVNILSQANSFLVVPVNFCEIKFNENITSKDCLDMFTTYKSLITILEENENILNSISYNLLENKFSLPSFSLKDYTILEHEFNEIEKILKKKTFDCSHDVLNYFRYIKEMAEVQVKKYDVSISIVIPTFNVERFIDDCLNSIINQSFNDFEVIVVDDCSTDSTLDIVEYYSEQDNRIRYFKNDTKCGSGGSRNFGLTQARGKYVQFVDGDDWLDHDALDKLYNLAEEYHTQTVMFKVINFEDVGTHFIKDSYLAMSCLDRFNNSLFNSNMICDELFDISVVAMNKLYLRSFLVDIGARFPEKYIHQDNPFFYQTFCESERIFLADLYLYNRRLWHGSITHKRDDTELGTIEIVEEILNVFLDNNLYDKYKVYLLNRLLFKLRNRYRLVGGDYKKEYYYKAKEKMEKFFFVYCLFDDFVECLWPENKLFFDRLVFSESFEEFSS